MLVCMRLWLHGCACVHVSVYGIEGFVWGLGECVCVCVCACVHLCVRVCVCVYSIEGGLEVCVYVRVLVRVVA